MGGLGICFPTDESVGCECECLQLKDNLLLFVIHVGGVLCRFISTFRYGIHSI